MLLRKRGQQKGCLGFFGDFCEPKVSAIVVEWNVRGCLFVHCEETIAVPK